MGPSQMGLFQKKSAGKQTNRGGELVLLGYFGTVRTRLFSNWRKWIDAFGRVPANTMQELRLYVLGFLFCRGMLVTFASTATRRAVLSGCMECGDVKSSLRSYTFAHLLSRRARGGQSLLSADAD